MAATALLRARGVEVVSMDSRSPEALELAPFSTDTGIEWRLGLEPSELPPRIDGVVVSPGVPPDRPLIIEARGEGLPVCPAM